MPIERVTTVVIGAGHTGLAMSRMLTERSIEHVVLERGEVANSWRHERWDSLRLLTPNSQSRLPGYAYAGADPNGFMTMRGGRRLHRRLRGRRSRRRSARRPRSTSRAAGRRRLLASSRRSGELRVSAAASSSRAAHATCRVVPALRVARAASIASFTPFDYRNPQSLPDGGVLVVGASATGVQLADEIQRSGRRVLLSVGEHVRLPRTYRGRDVLWWMEATGVWNQRYDEIDDVERARKLPSPQLVGSPRARDARSQRAEPRRASRSSGGSPRSATGARCSRAACATSSRSRI